MQGELQNLKVIHKVREAKGEIFISYNKKIHDTIIDWYVRNNVDGTKWKFIKYYPEDQVVNHMKKSIAEVIQYLVDGPKFTEDWYIAYFGFWVKDKAQNGLFNLKQSVDNVLPPSPKVMTP